MKRVVALLLLLVALAACGSKDIAPKATGIPSTTAPSTTLPPVTFDTTTSTAPGQVASDTTSTSTSTSIATTTTTAAPGG
jgi:ABC-type glycerol-3-phosphate transport system substrate-binding protein